MSDRLRALADRLDQALTYSRPDLARGRPLPTLEDGGIRTA